MACHEPSRLVDLTRANIRNQWSDLRRDDAKSGE